MNSRRAWLMLAVGAFAYLISVLQRTSLSVAAVQATDRFGVTAATLATLAGAQLVVYAGMQLPAGVLVDRFGPRRVLVVGALLMVAGQIMLALSPTIGLAVAGRILVGAGDAASFVSVIRLTTMWFSGSRVPLLIQIVGVIGSGGQILSSFPLFAALHSWGWTPAYLSAASLSVIVAIVVIVIVRPGPEHAGYEQGPWRELPAVIRGVFSRPGTQLGFWSHFVAAGPTNMFGLLWGFPFLSIGLGYGPVAAAGLLTLNVATGAVVGPAIGAFTSRFPLRRSAVILGAVIAMGLAWALVLAWPGVPPFGVVLLMVIVTSAGGSASLVGLDVARSFNDSKSQGFATGFANVGGFTAAFVMMFLIGVVLDAIDRAHGGSGIPAQLYSLDSFRIAFLVQYAVVGIGVFFVLDARRRTRARLFDDEGIEVDPIWVSLMRTWRGRRA